MRPIFCLSIVSLVGMLSGWRPPTAQAQDVKIAAVDTQRLPGLAGVLQVGDNVFSGGEPAGEGGFASLQKLGVRTIVSVDGARPDVVRARGAGMRYVHIPLGYDGVTRSQSLALARVLQEYRGPFYFHCHHGRHRGPVAVALACVVTQKMSPPTALEILRLGGTSQRYQGLWQAVRKAQPRGAQEPLPELFEIAEVEPMAAVMARIDRLHDQLLAAIAEDTPAESIPDQETALHACLLLEESFHELVRHAPADRPADLQAQLATSETSAKELHQAVKNNDVRAFRQGVRRLQTTCNACHATYRN